MTSNFIIYGLGELVRIDWGAEKMRGSRFCYSIAEERRFIEQIGTWSRADRADKPTPEEALVGYIKGIDLRTDWDRRKKTECLNIAMAKLAEMRRTQ